MKKIILFIVLFFLALGATHHLLKKVDLHTNKEKEKEEFEWEEWEEEEGEEKTDQPEKFLLFHQGIRTREGEEIPGYAFGYKWNALQHAQSLARKRNAAGKKKSSGVLEWEERGPGNVPGRTRALFNVPGDPNGNTWLAGAATGGIWRTTDGGTSWTDRSSDFPALPISCFGADANATVIYAGTGEFVSSFYSAIGNGIFKSTDKGQTWSQLPSTNNQPEFSIITRLVVDPANANVIIASTAPHNLSKGNSAIMRSTDGGATWTKVMESAKAFEQVIASPADFNIQYASQNGVGIWKSTDGGMTWSLSNAGMTPSGRIEIAISPVNSSKVFASAEGTLSGNNSDLYYSSDAGATWSLVDVKFNNSVVDFFEGQGFYDNTIMCDPFHENIVYFGGVSLFRSTLTSGSSAIDNFNVTEDGTETFMLLQAYTGIEYSGERLSVGNPKPDFDVEIRFGPGISQKAHRFTVPANRTSGVEANEYIYKDYNTIIPFQAWDVTHNRQLMVSFRDQNQNSKFDLLPAYNTSDGVDYLLNSREYVYIHNITYNAVTPGSSIDQAGGQEANLAYNFFPALADGAAWDPSNLPASTLKINHYTIQKFNSSTVTVADGRGTFDNKNNSNQVDLDRGVHPDHHFMLPIIVNKPAKTYRILLANDGGVFVSKVSDTPGITDGDWSFKGTGLNTSQFYGADKRPGAEQYLGGMQDNGTRLSPQDEVATATSNYVYGIGGDGFEVIWNSRDPDKMLGSVYNGQISRSVNGGISWNDATTGLPAGSSEFSFITRLANAKDFPDRVFTVGTQGVYVSEDFGGSWDLTVIPEKFVLASPLYLDVEVSRADANIVWAGSGMDAGSRNLFVSTDGGKTFQETNNFTTVPMGNITKLASHPSEPNTAYALFSFAHAPKILRTTDLGETWEDISGFGTGTSSTNGFPDVAVYCLYVRPDDPDILWAGTEIGIVESMDNGETWELLDDFPNVAVWDMKGQDDEVVIATHGRGIWSAKINAKQEITHAPEIIASGTSPQQKLMLRISATEHFDSLKLYVGSKLSQRLLNINAGIMDVELNNISPGEKEIRLVSFKGSSPYQSTIYHAEQLDILPQQDSYSTFFSNLDDLTVEGMSLQSFPDTPTQFRQALHSEHGYATDKNYEVIVRTPVKVSADLPVLFYSDIAIIEPGSDYVSVEATKNGLDWISLTPAYDASANPDWVMAYNNGTAGTRSMLVKHEVNITDKFATGDTLLFRLKMVSGPAVTSWGWAVDYITIQEEPLSLEPLPSEIRLTLYPNPTPGPLTVEYALKKTSPVSLEIIDLFGRRIGFYDLGTKNAGFNETKVDLQNQATGNYILVFHTEEGDQTAKVSVRR